MPRSYISNFWTAAVVCWGSLIRTRRTQIALSLLRLEQRRYQDAEPLLREVVSTLERARPDAWTRFHAQSLLGASLAGQMKYNDAEPLLISGYQGLLERESTIPAFE